MLLAPIQTDGEVKSGLEDDLSQTDIWELAASADCLGEVSEILAEHSVASMWFTQPARQHSFQSRSTADLEPIEIDELVSKLTGLVDAFEIAYFGQEAALYAFDKSLGLRRLSIDGAGEITLRAGQLERLIEEASGNLAEFQRLLRQETALGLLDQLEPLRRSVPRIDQLPRAV